MPQRLPKVDTVGNTQLISFAQGRTFPVPDDDIPSCDCSEGQTMGTTNVAGEQQLLTFPDSSRAQFCSHLALAPWWLLEAFS